MANLAVELKKPSELSLVEVDAWNMFKRYNPDLVSPYFSLEYARCCEIARSDTRILVIRKGSDLKGFLALQKGRFGFARPLSGPLSDVHGVVCTGQDELNLQSALSQAGIPVFEYHSGLGMQHIWGDNARVYDGSWVIDLSDGYEAFVDHRTSVEPKAFRNIRARRRKLEDESDFEFIIDDRRPEALEKMIEWKSAQYKKTGVFDVFSVAWTRALMDQLILCEGAGFAGLCSTLNIDGKIAAVHMGMRSEERLHYWFPAYDPEYNRFSPGLLLLMEIAHWSAGRGLRSIELGPGDYDFKKHLSSYQIPLAEGSLTTLSMPTMLRSMTQGLVGGIEKLPLGKIANLPRKALRKMDRLASFYAL